MDEVGAVLLENDVNTDEQFAADCAKSGAMRLTLFAFFLVIHFQLVIVPNGHGSRLPERETQIRRAAFTHVHLTRIELPRLVNGGVNACIGD